MYICFMHLGLPNPTKRQYEIAYYMQHGPEKVVVQAFRGIGKSLIASLFVLWVLWCNPELKVMVYSAAKPRADAFSTFCLRLINEIEVLHELRPKPEQRQSTIMFDVGPATAAQAPSMMSIGIFGSATGFRCDLLVMDDIEVPNNSETQLQREKLKDRSREAPGAILKPGGRVIVLGTPQTEDSIYRDFPERNYAVRVWPSEYPDEKTIEARGHELAPEIIEAVRKDPSLAGHATEPIRFPDDELFKRKLEYGPSGYALQFLLDTRLSDADKHPLRVRDLIVYPLDMNQGPEKIIYVPTAEQLVNTVFNVALPGDRYYRGLVLRDTKWMPWEGTIMYIDPAGRGKDETAYTVLSHLNGMLYLRDNGGLKGYDEPTLVELVKVCKRFNVQRIIVERNFGDGMFARLLQPVVGRLYPCPVEEDDWQTGQKERRICDILEPVIASHRLVVDEKLIEKDYNSTRGVGLSIESEPLYRLFFQLTRITRDKGALRHDDRLDSLAGAVRHLSRIVGTNVEDMVEISRQAELDRERESFIEYVTGMNGTSSSNRMCAWA